MTASVPWDDERLSQLYQHVAEQQAGRFSAGYDLPAGLGRYRAWLHEFAQAGGTRAADQAVTGLYAQHYRTLVRLAAFLVDDPAAAEELVQDSFVALHAAWPGLPGTGHALAFLHRSVIQCSRSPRYHGTAAGTGRRPARAAGQQQAGSPPGGPALGAALRSLPARQREALVLRCYADLPDDQIAAAMGVSRSAVRTCAARAASSLQRTLPETGRQAVPGSPASADLPRY